MHVVYVVLGPSETTLAMLFWGAIGGFLSKLFDTEDYIDFQRSNWYVTIVQQLSYLTRMVFTLYSINLFFEIHSVRTFCLLTFFFQWRTCCVSVLHSGCIEVMTAVACCKKWTRGARVRLPVVTFRATRALCEQTRPVLCLWSVVFSAKTNINS